MRRQMGRVQPVILLRIRFSLRPRRFVLAQAPLLADELARKNPQDQVLARCGTTGG
jgi:hypothetical protein